MKNSFKRPLGGFILAGLAAAGFGCVALLIGMDKIGPFDSAVIKVVQGWESGGLTSLAEGLSWLGSTKPVIALGALLAIFMFMVLRHRKELILFAAALGGAAVLNKLLKAVFQRVRPDIHPIVAETGYSFPSGHTMAAFALYGVLLYLLWRHLAGRWGRGLLIAICAILFLGIALSRIYLGVHYPSDILGGLLASAAWLSACIGVYEQRGWRQRTSASEREEAA